MGNDINNRVVIIGAGLTGLSAAYHAGKKGIDYQLFEKNSKVGGLCSSKNVDGFIFDYAEHFLRIPNTYVRDIVDELLPNLLGSQSVNSSIYIYGRHIKYPFQKNLGELPSGVLKECVLGFVQEYYESRKDTPIRNFEDWIVRTFGSGIAKHFMIPYNAKIWTVPPKEMNISWFFDNKVVSSCSIDDILEGALYPIEKRNNEEDIRWYPLSGGVEVISKAFLSEVKNIKLDKCVTEINLKRKIVTFTDGVRVHYEYIISTIPLIELRGIMQDLSAEVSNAMSDLKYNSVLCVNLGVDREYLSDKHWIYFPEKKYIFTRVYFPMNFSPDMVPKGKSSVSAIITYSDVKPLEKACIVERTIKDLKKANILLDDYKIIVEDVMDIKYGFPIPDLDRNKKVETIQTYLRNNNFFSIGRYGNWKYSGMEHAIGQGKRVIQKIDNLDV